MIVWQLAFEVMPWRKLAADAFWCMVLGPRRAAGLIKVQSKYAGRQRGSAAGNKKPSVTQRALGSRGSHLVVLGQVTSLKCASE